MEKYKHRFVKFVNCIFHNYLENGRYVTKYRKCRVYTVISFIRSMLYDVYCYFKQDIKKRNRRQMGEIMQTVLSVRELEKTFKNKKVLHGISFDIHKGEIIALLGPNGAGKSTTIRSIMEILYPDSGSIQFNFEQSEKIQRNKIGYLPEERGLYKSVKVLDMLLYLAELKDYPMMDAKKRITYYLEKFDLKGKENATIDTLSKGMAQKVQFIGT